MTNQSHTELAAQALRLAKSRLEDERGTYEWSIDAEITLRQCAAALESPERVQGGLPEHCTSGNCPCIKCPRATPPTAPTLDAQGEVVAFEFYNAATGHAIVDYTQQTHVGPLTKEMGYEARPLGYINPPPAAVKIGDPVPLWQAREALDSLEESARGDAPFNHYAANLIRMALEQAVAPLPHAVGKPLSDEHGAIISAYEITDGLNGVHVDRVQQLQGPAKWAVRCANGSVLSRKGHWDWEPMPSSRTDEWLAEFRFDTAEEAISAAHGIVTKEST